MRTSAGVVVDVSVDAGAFYCEHAAFVGRAMAERADGVGAAVARRDGLPQVGFLHVPPDVHPGRVTQAVRHRDTREVVGAAVRGFVDGADGDDVRILLTGFEPWGTVIRNPSGDFISHAANLDAVAAIAGFGRGARGADGGRRHRRRGRTLTLYPWLLPVDDDAINHGPRSLQAAMGAVVPHVVLSMGVHRRHEAFRVELVASDKRLRSSPRPGHDENLATARHTFPPNDALARAIVSGWRSSMSLASSSSTAPAG